MAGKTADRCLYIVRYRPDESPRPLPWPTNVPERLEWIWDNYCKMSARVEWLDDDALPYLDMLTGTELFAEAFGCEVFRPDNDMPSARPLAFSAREASALKVPSLDAPPLRRVFEMADELKRRAGKDALMRTVDVQSPIDITALIWDKNDLYAAFVEAPDAVREVADKVQALLTAFLDEWFRRYGREHIAHCPDYFMDGGWTVSEDEVGVVGEQVFEELFLPELNLLSDRYGGIGIHCCANSRHQWAGFKRIRGLRLLNICQPVETVREAYEFFEKDVVHWHSWNGDGDCWTWADQHPPGARFVIDAWADDREQALRLVEKLRNRR